MHRFLLLLPILIFSGPAYAYECGQFNFECTKVGSGGKKSFTIWTNKDKNCASTTAEGKIVARLCNITAGGFHKEGDTVALQWKTCDQDRIKECVVVDKTTFEKKKNSYPTFKATHTSQGVSTALDCWQIMGCNPFGASGVGCEYDR